jgi:hypothetical protein
VTLAGWGWFALMLCLAFVLARHYGLLAAVAAGGVLFAVLMPVLRGSVEGEQWSAAVAPALMGAFAVTVLFGGLIACTALAIKGRRMAGLSMEADHGPEVEEARERERREGNGGE